MKDFNFASLPAVVIASLFSAGAAVVGWSYDNFQTKHDASSYSQQIEKRLERIENKLDRLVEHMR